MPIEHRTDRLALRELEPGDAAFIVELLSSPGWQRYIGPSEAKTEEDGRIYIERAAKRSYEKHGFGLLHVEEIESGTSIGICGLVRRPTLDAPDLGFAFLDEHCGHGYATEAGRVILKDAFQEHDFDEILAVTTPANIASVRVLEKLGFERRGPVISDPDGRETQTFRIGKPR